jgi:hypothetical protein
VFIPDVLWPSGLTEQDLCDATRESVENKEEAIRALFALRGSS